MEFKKISVPQTYTSTRDIQVNGILIVIPYVRAGIENPTTLIFPGLSGSGTIPFGNDVPDLSELGKGARVIAVDIPPVGGLNPTLTLGTEILRQCVRETGAKNLIAYSAGGAMAINFCLQYPGQVDKLVLVASAGLGQEIYKGFCWMTLPVLGDILTRLRVRPTEKSVEKFLKILFHDSEKIPKKLAQALLEQRVGWGFKKWRKWYLGTLRQGVNFKGQKISFLEKIPELTIPTLLICGENDRIIPPSHTKNAWDISYKTWLQDSSKKLVRFAPIKNCGHWPQMERAEEFNQIVAQFLGR